MKLRAGLFSILAALASLLLARTLYAEVSLEEVVQAGRFVFYRDSGDPHKYYYAPDQPRLASGPDGKPEFTFIKYTRAGAEGTNAQAKGGLVHFLITWGFDDSTRSAAENALKGQDSDAVLVGPIPFKEGSFTLVSASAGEGGIFNRKIVGTGKAPILPGMKAAVSIALTPEGATLLWESFQKPTSEVSVVFLLKFSGLTPAFSAKLKVNWDKVYSHHDVAAGVSGQYAFVKAAADVRAIFDEFRKNGTIKLEVTGENQNMQKLLDTAYEHILRQMFDPVMLPPEAATTPQAGGGSTGGSIGGRSTPQPPIPLELLARYPVNIQDTPLSDGKFFAILDTSARTPMGWLIGEGGGEESPGGAAPPTSRTDSWAGNAAEEILAPIVEPYTPQGTDQERKNVMKQIFDSAVQDAQAGRCTDALPQFVSLYRRSYPAGDRLARLSRNIAVCYANLDQLERAIFFAGLTVGSGSAEGEEARVMRAEVRRLDALIRQRHLTLPPAIARFGQSNESVLRQYAGKLDDARESYFLGDMAAALQKAQDASRVFPFLSEPFLWVARALDRQENREQALQNYRDYMQRLDDEGEDINPSVEIRISQLVELAAPQAPREAGRTGDVADRAEGGASGGSPAEGAGAGTPRSGGAAPGATAPGAGGGTTSPPAGGGSTPVRPTSGTTPPSGGQTPAPATPASVELRVSYVYRRIKQTGTYEVDLRQRLREDRELTMAGNIGGFIKSQQDKERYLLEVNLDDPFFQDRKVEVLLDGQDYEDLKKYVNAVVVQFRRKHDDATSTEGDVRFMADQFAAQGNRLTWIYPRLGDKPAAWLNFEYQVVWQFYGGAQNESPWTSTENSVLTITPPVKYRTLRINLDQNNLANNGVQAVAISFRNRLFGRQVSSEVVVDYSGGDPLQALYRYLQLENDNTYDMKVIWTLTDGTEITKDWVKREGTIVPLRFIR